MKSNGFTLVEMLIALSIFALLSIAGVSLLSFGIDSRQRTAERLNTLASIVRTRSLLSADLAQAVPRTWRDTNGLRRPAFSGSNNSTGIELIRSGWANDGGAARSSLQRVSYRLEGDQFVRISSPMVDGAIENPPAVLLTGVKSLRMRFHAAGVWRDDWQAEIADALPDAVEITVASKTIEPVRQVFVVGPGLAS
jgi:general secretion pathway protein J